MTSRILRRSDLLLLVVAASMAMIGSSWAKSAHQIDAAESPLGLAANADGPTGDALDSATDWSQLNADGYTLSAEGSLQNRRSPQPASHDTLAWTSRNNADGSAALTVKQSVSPLWDTSIGADMTVVRQTTPLTASDLATDKLGINGPPSQSSGTAWAAATAPGVGSIWDKTALEARIDPAQDQTRFNTSLSKSVPLDEGQYALTLQNGYNVIQQGTTPIPGVAGHLARSYGTEQSATLNVTDTGTSLMTGQSLSSTNDKWLRKIGAEQKLFGGVSVTGSISEAPLGPVNRSIGAAFKRSW